MIETALTIIVVVMAALGMGLHFCLMRTQNLLNKQREVARGWESIAGFWKDSAGSRSDSVNKAERRYHAALRALRTRQAVIDGLARERDFAVSNYGMIERVWKQRETDMNSDLAAAKAKALFYQTQAEQCAKGNRTLLATNLDLVKHSNRLAAQLKKLKARKA